MGEIERMVETVEGRRVWLAGMAMNAILRQYAYFVDDQMASISRQSQEIADMLMAQLDKTSLGSIVQKAADRLESEE